VTLTAATALPYDDLARATAGLRGQLSELAAAGGQLPDWSTLTMTGPVEATGAHGRTWYRWTATVEAH
jgi:hypothetical protein